MKISKVQVLFLVLSWSALHVLAHKAAAPAPEPEPEPEPEDCETTPAPEDCESTTTTCPPTTTSCPPTTTPCTTTTPCPTTTTPCTAVPETPAPETPAPEPETPEPEPTTISPDVFTEPLAYSGKKSCRGLDDGTILIESRHCRCYYICRRNKAIRRRCRPGFWFDRADLTCRVKSQVNNCPAMRN